jgi:Protein of unknown function (DUF1488)
MPEITFLDDIQGNEEWVRFLATVDGKPTMCKISLEALANRFHATEPTAPRLSDTQGPLKVFQANRADVENIARRLIQVRRYEPDGSIVIHGTDV